MATLEHFPGVAIQSYIQAKQEIPGAGAPLVALFSCTSPEGSGAAEEAAELLAETIMEIESRTREWSRWKRTTVAVRDGTRFRDSVRGMPPAYRPPAPSGDE